MSNTPPPPYEQATQTSVQLQLKRQAPLPPSAPPMEFDSESTVSDGVIQGDVYEKVTYQFTNNQPKKCCIVS